MEVENGYVWKVTTIGDTPIFDFHDYGRKCNLWLSWRYINVKRPCHHPKTYGAVRTLRVQHHLDYICQKRTSKIQNEIIRFYIFNSEHQSEIYFMRSLPLPYQSENFPFFVSLTTKLYCGAIMRAIFWLALSREWWNQPLHWYIGDSFPHSLLRASQFWRILQLNYFADVFVWSDVRLRAEMQSFARRSWNAPSDVRSFEFSSSKYCLPNQLWLVLEPPILKTCASQSISFAKNRGNKILWKKCPPKKKLQ